MEKFKEYREIYLESFIIILDLKVTPWCYDGGSFRFRKVLGMASANRGFI
jgi:hypothetical protein